MVKAVVVARPISAPLTSYYKITVAPAQAGAQ
jgi:hypothetical protein